MIQLGWVNVLPYFSVDLLAFLASFIMSDDTNEKNNAKEPKQKDPKSTIKADWGTSLQGGRKFLFDKKDFDIFCDKELGETYIFHAPELGCTIDFLEYNPEDQRVTVYTIDGQKMDLGARIQWLVRPYFTKAKTILMVRTQNGKAIDGVEVRLKIKGWTDEKTLN